LKRYRIADQTPLKSKRLILTPMNEKELTARMDLETDALIKGKLAEMVHGTAENPDQALWHTGWLISLALSGESVGLIALHGMPEDRMVKLAYEIDDAHRGNGYAAEAVKALAKWAFTQEGVYFIQVLTDDSDTASNHIQQGLKFYRVESPFEGKALWELERPASMWLAFYLCVGLAVGFVFGSSFFGSQILGLIVVTSAGITLGAVLDAKDRAARKREHPPEKIIGEKEATCGE
jgi:RimJ/RimL family protein N-acetyltransferase